MNDVKPIPKDKTAQKIINFAQKVKKVKLGEKSGDETMSVEDAKWNIEAALNYYNYPEEIPMNAQIIEEEIVKDISPVDNNLTLNEISVIVVEMNAAINDDPTKKFLSADVEVVNNLDGTKSMKMTSSILIGGWNGFNQDDYWDYESGGGFCDGLNQGVPTPYGAPEVLARQVNVFGLGGLGSFTDRFIGYYYTNVSSYTYIHTPDSYYDYYGNSMDLVNPNDDIPNDGYNDFLLFQTSDFLEDLCLSPDEMNFYALTGIPTLIPNLLFDGNSFMRINIFSDFTSCTDCDNTYFHYISLQQGEKHAYSPPDDNPF